MQNAKMQSTNSAHARDTELAYLYYSLQILRIYRADMFPQAKSSIYVVSVSEAPSSRYRIIREPGVGCTY
jgi:hypothetical protein